MIPLEHAALCRSEADWLIGINATRALTCYNSRHGGFSKTPCGRVQTPTLSLLVKREQERLAFIPKDYWELHAQFECGSVKYQGVWIDAAFKKDQEDPDGNKKRIWEEAPGLRRLLRNAQASRPRSQRKARRAVRLRPSCMI